MLLAATGLLALPPAAAAPADAAPSAVPAGFTDVRLADVPAPTALAFTPDGRGLVTTQGGQVRVLRPDGTLTAAPALDLSGRTCTQGERGLLGVAVDPDFARTGWFYLYWTRQNAAGCPFKTTAGPFNRVSRFTLSASGTASPRSEVVLAGYLPSFAGNHNGGDLRFGANGLLYVTVGDSGCQLTAPDRCAGENGNARRLDIPLGKVLRLTRSGAVPGGNPYASAPGTRHCTSPRGVPSGSGPCAETYASGLRNPFRFAVRPGTNTFYVNDVGQSDYEEVDVLAAGADYGWNACEGRHLRGSTAACPLSGDTLPLLEYSHDSGCRSITGGAFVPGGVFGDAHRGSYLYADFICGAILERTAGGTRRTFASGLGGGSAVTLTFGPYGSTRALYYLSYAGGGAVHRIARG